MEKFIFILLLIINPIYQGWCQNTEEIKFHSELERQFFQASEYNAFDLFIASDSSVDIHKYNKFNNEFRVMINQFKTLKSKSKSDLFLLEKLFYKIHRKHLGWYKNYVSLSEIFKSKNYDCLTGTAFIALILEELAIEYKILEFDFHIFLIAQLNESRVLIEATDPLYGFVKNESEIESRINKALLNNEISQQYLHTYLQNEINLLDLAGLQYYNLAVDLFNNQQYKKANQFIKKASLLNSNERIRKTGELISSASL